jgi:hypothetical protein
LRQQLTVLRRSAPKRLKLKPTDRIFWVWLRFVWTDWKSALMIVKAETVVAWHRKGFGHEFVEQVKAMGIKQVLSAPRSPWQRAYVERLIGSIRRECLDHFVVFGERSLRRTLTAYCAYYRNWRTHLSLGKDAPQSRRIQPATAGEMPEVGGLHHHYERRVAWRVLIPEDCSL